jgi:hypothetical protein
MDEPELRPGVEKAALISNHDGGERSDAFRQHQPGLLDAGRQEQVLAAEGTYTDFARSGMSDLSAFVMEDFLGAGFFHLILGLMLAVILGTMGVAIGKGIARIKK